MQAYYKKTGSTAAGSAASYSMQSKSKLESSTGSDDTKFYATNVDKTNKEASDERELTKEEVQLEESV